MTKLIVITGATGSQGGGVANILLNTPGWKVRAITRNPNSDKAKSLVSRGAEVVQADFNNAESLKKAFQVRISKCIPLSATQYRCQVTF
jgi:uncharacterized protein YbjT (DUF2867 family)